MVASVFPVSFLLLLFFPNQDESAMPPEVILKAKQLGFSDKQIALAVQRWVKIPDYWHHFLIICWLQT